MYKDSARFYDEIYGKKDYKTEAEKIHRIISKYKKSKGSLLLDLACGTGNHITYLKKYYQVEGLDISRRMLKIACEKHPSVKFYTADMARFNLGKKYDAIVCLFSAVGFVKTLRRLRSTLRSIKRHVRPGGVVIIEPWFSPEAWKTGTLHALFVDKPELKLARISTSSARGSISINRMHHLVGTRDKVHYFVETIELGLFTSRLSRGLSFSWFQSSI